MDMPMNRPPAVSTALYPAERNSAEIRSRSLSGGNRYTLAAYGSQGILSVTPTEAPAAAADSTSSRQAVAAMLKEFAAHAAHEVSNPLNAIGINAELSLSLLKLGRVAEATEMLQRLSRDCWQAGEEVRAFSRLGESLAQPTQPCDIGQLINDVLARIAGETQRPLEFFHLQIQPDLPPAQIEAFGATYALRYLARRLISDALRCLCLTVRALGAHHQLLTVYCDFVPAMDPGATRPPLRLSFFQQLLVAQGIQLDWLKDGRTGFEVVFPHAPG